jgi:hypothetical protein
VRTRHLQLVSSEHSDTTHNRESVRSHFGPVRAGLTTSQTTPEVQLTELLSSLENVVANLNYKSFEVYDTLCTAIETVSVALSGTRIESAGTDDNVRRVW